MIQEKPDELTKEEYWAAIARGRFLVGMSTDGIIKEETSDRYINNAIDEAVKNKLLKEKFDETNEAMKEI